MRGCALVLVLLASAVRAAPSPDATPNATDAAVDELGAPPGATAPGPTVAAVLAAAYRTAGLAHDPSGGWILRARVAGLIPWVTVRGARDTTWDDAQPEVGHSQTVEVRATWRLDRLLFDGRELHVAGIEAQRHRERRRLASRVIRAYFAWRRAVAAASAPGTGALRIEETVADLDALTDGWFSDELDRTRHAASETRTPKAHP